MATAERTTRLRITLETDRPVFQYYVLELQLPTPSERLANYVFTLTPGSGT